MSEKLRIGLVSDTHGLLRNEVYAAFDGVDEIFHAGDIGDPSILTELEVIEGSAGAGPGSEPGEEPGPATLH